MGIFDRSKLLVAFSIFGFSLAIAKTSITYEELQKLEDFNGLSERAETRKVDKKVYRVLAENRDYIIELGQKFGIDPRAISGAIIAENSMNGGISDEVQNYLASFGVTKLPGTGSFSYGLGQIHDFAAIPAEKYIAAKEGRPERSSDSIRKEILTPKGSIYYAAAIMAQAKDAYAKEGFDISKNPGVLASIFNTGTTRKFSSLEERAKAKKATGEAPGVNYFGYFVEKHMQEVEDGIGWSPEKGKYSVKLYQNTRYNDDGYPVLKNAVEVATSAGQIKTAEELESHDAQMYKDGAKEMRRKFKKISGAYQIVDRSVDDDFNDILLIKNDQGETGWIRSNYLAENTDENKRAPPFNCDTKRQDCYNKVKNATGFEAIREDQGIIEMPLASGKPGVAANYKSFGLTCLLSPEQREALKKEQESHSYTQTGFVNFGYSGDNFGHGYRSLSSGTTTTLVNRSDYKEVLGRPGFGRHEIIKMYLKPKSQLNLLKKMVDDTKRKIMTERKLSSWDDSRNPFRGAFYFAEALDRCDSQCWVASENILTLLKTDFNNVNTIQKYQKLTDLGETCFIENPNAVVEAKKNMTEQIAEIKKVCDFTGLMDTKFLLFYQMHLDRLTLTDEELQKASYDPNLYNQVINNCKGAKAIASYRKNKSADLTEAKQCSMQSNSVSTTADFLIALGADNSEVEPFLIGALVNLDSSAIQLGKMGEYRPYVAQDCLYDPIKSSEMAAKVLDLPCVESITVPDKSLFRTLSNKYPGRVSMAGPSHEGDFGVILKDKCQDTGKAVSDGSFSISKSLRLFGILN